jgi:hypothetical protein
VEGGCFPACGGGGSKDRGWGVWRYQYPRPKSDTFFKTGFPMWSLIKVVCVVTIIGVLILHFPWVAVIVGCLVVLIVVSERSY